MGILVSAKESSKEALSGVTTERETDCKDAMDSFDLGLSGAGGFAFSLGEMTGSAEIGYTRGLLDLDDSGSDDASLKTRNLFIVFWIRKNISR